MLQFVKILAKVTETIRSVLSSFEITRSAEGVLWANRCGLRAPFWAGATFWRSGGLMGGMHGYARGQRCEGDSVPEMETRRWAASRRDGVAEGDHPAWIER